jgi:hypothetical protein
VYFKIFDEFQNNHLIRPFILLCSSTHTSTPKKVLFSDPAATNISSFVQASVALVQTDAENRIASALDYARERGFVPEELRSDVPRLAVLLLGSGPLDANGPTVSLFSNLLS